ncbi:MAG: response regulator [Gammaproteobacteria bacterium]|jgi:two-component system response regulator RstA
MTKILLVEDDEQLAKLIQSFLIELGYSVNCEYRGDKAIFRIIREQPDIVILDIMLPGLDGIQVCQSIRGSYNGMVVMLTALDDDETQIAGLNIGADDYINKPIEPRVLAARLDALIRREKRIKKITELEFGRLKINLITRVVMLNNQQISLKPKEYELLIFLANNADKVVNRDNIMLALRGTHYDGIDRTIDLRISYLRKKLKDNLENPLRIKTVRNLGYVFISNAWDT